MMYKFFHSPQFSSINKHQIDLFDQIESIFHNSTFHESVDKKYPPHNLRSNGKDAYRIELAVAGYEEKDLKISREKNYLVIEGSIDDKESDENFLVHRGIANRSFKKSFALSENIKVVGATIKNGLLIIGLIKEIPEAEKPVKIPITTDVSELDKILKKAEELPELESIST